MTQPGAKPGKGRLWKYLPAAFAGACVLLGVLAWYVSTESFQAMVRRRLVWKLEQATGGRVDLGSIHTVPFRFLADIRDVTIHGREGPGEIPYAHVDRVVAQVRLSAALGSELGFHSLVLERPVVHLIIYPDGSTNQPPSTQKTTSTKDQIAKLFSISVGRLEVRHGELIMNDQKIPLDFEAQNVSADMAYSLLHRHYALDLLVGKADTKVSNYRPVAWTAEGHFNLSRDGVEIKSLKATSGKAHLQFSGRMVDFNQPNLVGHYDATVDLQEAGAVLRWTQLRRGSLEISGQGSWGGALFSSEGRVQARDVDWKDESLALQNAQLSSQFSLNPRKLSLSAITGKLLSGDVTGEAEILNWLNAAPDKKVRDKTVAEQRGSVRLRVRNLSAQEIAEAISSSSRPLRRMNLAGAATGTVEAHWRGDPKSFESEITLDVASPRQLLNRQLPVDAHIHAIYRNAPGELEVAEFTANTRATQVRASGTLSTRATLKFAVTTSDLREWEPVLGALGYTEPLPVSIQGRASFNGTASGKLSAVQVVGRLQSQDFETLIWANPGNRRIRWDYLAADVQISPDGFAARNGTLHHGDAVIHFDVNAGLTNRAFGNSSPFSAKAQWHNADLAEVLSLAGFHYAVSGKVDGSVQASGSREQPEGQGTVHLSDVVVAGENVQNFESKFAFNRQQFALEDIHLAHGQALVTGGGTYDFHTHALNLTLAGNNFDLTEFRILQSTRIAVEGRMDFSAQTSGTLEEPTINAKLQLHDLAFGHERAGDYTLNAITQGPELRLSGRSSFDKASLEVDGTAQMRGNWPSTLNLRFTQLDIDPVLRAYLDAPVTGHSSTSGTLELRGPLREPGKLQMSGDISDFVAEVAHVQLRNNGGFHFTISEQAFNIQRLRLIGEGTDLEVGGSMQLTGDRPLDLHAEGHVDLGLIHSYNPDFNASGQTAVDLTVTGNTSRPIIQGRLQTSKGMVAYADLPSALSDINGSLVFNQNRLEIESLTAHVGGGQVEFKGYAAAYNHQLNFDVSVQGQDVRLRYPPGVSSMTNAELRWAGTPAASTFSGNATITKLAVTPGFDFASYIASSSQSNALPQTNPLLNRIRMDIHILTTPELQMQTATARLSGDADLRLRGTAAKPVLLGRANVLEGDVYFNGTKYRMERGDITFTNPVTTTPVLDLQASTRVQDYDITVNLNGQFDKLNLSYHSDPPLSTADIISLLALGQTQGQSAQLQQAGQSPFAQQASSAVLAEALNSALSNRSQRLFGISHIKIDPMGLNNETTPTQTTPLPAVTIEQQVRDNITLTYTTNVAQTSQQIIQGEYNITRDLSFVGIRDYNGVVSFEVRLRRRRK